MIFLMSSVFAPATPDWQALAGIFGALIFLGWFVNKMVDVFWPEDRK